MLHEDLYNSCGISQLYQVQQASRNSYCPNSMYSEREVMIKMMHALLGLSGSIFQKSSSDKLFQWNDNVRPMMSHLTCDTLHNSQSKVLAIVNQLCYISQHVHTLSKHPSFMVQELATGIYQMLGQLRSQFSSILLRIRKQSGVIPHQQSHQKPLTIITLITLLQNKQEILATVTLVLKSGLNSNHKELTIFNKCTQIINQFACYPTCNMHSIISVFMPFLIAYFKLIRDWIRMDYQKLSMKNGVQFFINFQRFNPKKKKENNNLPSKIHQPTLEDRSIDNENSTDKLFELNNNMFDPTLVPELLEKYADKVLHLGQSIEFIYMYFEHHQYSKLNQCFQVEKQFEQLLNYCQKWTYTSIVTKQPAKKVVFSTISSRIRGRTNKKMQQLQHSRDNPYDMLVSTEGTFEISPLIEKEHFEKKHFEKEQQNIRGEDKVKGCCVIRILMEMFGCILDRINQKCLRFLQQKKGIEDTIAVRVQEALRNCLVGIKKFMLFQQGDFIHEFLSLVIKVFDNPQQKISKNLVSNYISEAMKSSNANKLPPQIRDHVTFTYLRGKNSSQPNYLKGWTNFSIIYQPQQPTNAIFTTAVMHQFASVFNFIFNIKKCQYFARNVWKHEKTTYHQVTPAKTQLKQRILKLRHQITHYTHCILSYILLNIDIIWNDFLHNLQNASNMMQIIGLLHKVLGDIHKYTISNKTLFNLWMILNEVVDKFILIHHNEYLQDVVVLMQELCKCEQSFEGVVKLSRQIDGFKDIANFNMHMLI